MRSKTWLATFVGLTSILIITASASAQGAAAPPAPPRQVSVSGESTVYVTPDEVVIGVGVETFDKSLDATKKANDERSRTLLAAIKDAGVEERHIQTDDLRVSIDYNNGGAARGVEGYLAHREYRVTLKDPKKTEALVDACLKNGANLLLGIDYRTTELRKHRDDARRMAIKAAREKAALLAGELGEQVGRPRTISEGSFGYYGWYGGWNRGGNYMAQNSFQVRDGGAGIEGQTIPIGQVAITAQVSVTFDLAG
jgi:uncharacterized protein YggE